jgi:hypothetical protein
VSSRSDSVEAIDLDPRLNFSVSKNVESGSIKLEPRENHSSVVCDGKIYVFGGRKNVGNVSTCFFSLFISIPYNYTHDFDHPFCHPIPVISSCLMKSWMI